MLKFPSLVEFIDQNRNKSINTIENQDVFRKYHSHDMEIMVQNALTQEYYYNMHQTLNPESFEIYE